MVKKLKILNADNEENVEYFIYIYLKVSTIIGTYFH